MVMARLSLHRRNDTLDLVQIVPNVDKIILVFTTRHYVLVRKAQKRMTCNYSHQQYKHSYM